jgi:nucleoid DNA-binding protein
MDKKELVNQVAHEIVLATKNEINNSPLNKKRGSDLVTAEKTVNAIFKAIKDFLQKGEVVRLIGFGTFAVKQRQARVSRNPRTGETIQVPAKHVVRFNPGKALKEEVAEQSKEAAESKKGKTP